MQRLDRKRLRSLVLRERRVRAAATRSPLPARSTGTLALARRPILEQIAFQSSLSGHSKGVSG